MVVRHRSHAMSKKPYLFAFGCFPRLLTDKIKPDAENVVNMANSAPAYAVSYGAASLSHAIALSEGGRAPDQPPAIAQYPFVRALDL